MTRATTDVLFESGRFVVGTFRCDLSDPRWKHENSIDDGFNVVFPATPVRITPAGAYEVLSDRNQVMLYDYGQRFRRDPASPEGDVCIFVVVDEAFLRATAGAAGMRTGRHFSFGAPFVPCPPDIYLGSRSIVHRLRTQQLTGPEADARLADVVRRVVDRVAEASRRAPGRDAAPPPGHVALAEDVKAILADFAAPARVADIADRVSVSQFHLARVFRRHTGFTLHGYRDQLRLRYCLDRLVAGDASVSDLSYAAGYSSPSHLCENFRRCFGFPPSRALAVMHRG